MAYKKGDRVKHRAKFLRSLCWFTNVPRYGTVTEDQVEGNPVVRVQWCDQVEVTPILDVHILPFDRLDASLW